MKKILFTLAIGLICNSVQAQDTANSIDINPPASAVTAAPAEAVTTTATPATTEAAVPAPAQTFPAELNVKDTVLEKPVQKKPVVRKKSSQKKSVRSLKGMPASMAYKYGKRTDGKKPINFDTSKLVNNFDSAMRSYFPRENVSGRRVGSSLVLSGVVTDAEIAARIVQLAESYKGKAGYSSVNNLMQIKSSQQVMLRVRIGEVKRSALKKYGAAGLASLERDGLVKILAEPNLTAISGEKATFLSGGEIPVPVQSNGGNTVDYKDYGASLEFTPYVLSQNRIRLNVASEVSSLTDKGAVQTAGTMIPALSTRKAKTTVELAPGESFMIAGLIKDNVDINSSGATPLSAIPVIGSLLRGSALDRDETELVISVIPYLVEPMRADSVKLPSDGFAAPSNLETIILGDIGDSNNSTKMQPETGNKSSGIFDSIIN